MFNSVLMYSVILIILCSFVDHFVCERTRRFLTFPRTSPTRLQLITGVGIPVELGFEAVTIGYVFKVEFFLPENASNYLNILADPFDITTRPISGFFVRKRRVLEEPAPTPKPELLKDELSSAEKVEKYNAIPELIEDDKNNDEIDENEMNDIDYWNQEEPNAWDNYPLKPRKPFDLGMSRWTVYRAMAALLDSKGFVGKACVLRAICESAVANFDHSNGMLGEFMHIIMTPSTSKDMIVDNSHLEYHRAQQLGTNGEPCEYIFKECNISILDRFSGIYSEALDLIKEFTS